MGKLDGKVAVITGAGSGQGHAAARLFAREGASIVVGEWNADTGKETVDAIVGSGGKAVFAHCDVSDEAQVKAMIDLAASTFGRLDILYNNAGLWFSARGNYRRGETDAPSPLLEDNIWEKTIAVNLKSVYLGAKYAIPEMKKAGGGSIINASSTAAIKTGRGGNSDAYTAAKGGVLAITRTLAVEHGPFQIRCNCIVPGPIRTPLAGPFTPERDEMMRQAVPLGRWGQPEDTANMALFLASDDSSWITGQFFVVDGGLSAV